MYMNGYSPDSGRGDAVFRHEMGHWLDREIRSNNTERYYSSGKEFSDALKADAAIIRRREGMQRISDNAYTQNRVVNIGNEFDFRQKNLLSGDTARTVEELSNYVSFKLSPEGKNLIERLASDPGFNSLDVRRMNVSHEAEMVAIVADNVFGTRGIGTDLLGAATRNSIGYGHSNSYYKRSGNQQTEAFANITSIYGTGHPLAEDVLNYLAPNMFKVYKSKLSEVANGVN